MITNNKKIKIYFQIYLIISATNSWSLTFYDLGSSAAWPYGVSSTGAFVAGQSSSFGAFSWTKESGVQQLNFGVSYAYVLNVSGDGTALVGARSGLAPAFRFQNGIYQNLPFLSGQSNYNSYSDAYGVNYDGTTVVGEAAYDNGNKHAFVWRQDSGIFDIGTLTGSGWSKAKSVSHNGSNVVGTSAPTEGSFSSRAFLWNQEVGMQDLGILNGMNRSEGMAISGDGNTVVGYSENMTESGGSNAMRAFRWNSGLMQDLGLLYGGNYSAANGVNADGSVVVGSSDSTDSTRAFIWSSDDGMVDLNVYVESLGLNLDGFILREALAISSDGSTIVGWGGKGTDNNGFVISGIPEPSSLSLLAVGLGGLAVMRRRRS